MHVQVEYSEITPYIYVGTNLCCSAHADRLKELGADVDISLEYGETPIPEMFGTFLWLPTEDKRPPTMDQLDAGTALIRETVEKKRRAYIHCKNGHGRGPTLTMAYFIRYEGLTPEEAEAVVRKGRPEIEPTDAQRARLEEFEHHYGHHRGRAGDLNDKGPMGNKEQS